MRELERSCFVSNLRKREDNSLQMARKRRLPVESAGTSPVAYAQQMRSYHDEIAARASSSSTQPLFLAPSYSVALGVEGGTGERNQSLPRRFARQHFLCELEGLVQKLFAIFSLNFALGIGVD